ncbi:MAG: class I SAM-dependent methyltransferase [Candidatus Sumerlaeota bacterium]|nr:class I SAM-dependent methyltransferase [Candidatus Sumerlaeota bacterium]
MDERRAGQCWDANAEAWTTLARMGCDVYRDRVNTPAFMAMLPDVNGLHGLDIGCGEGHNTRLVVSRGARMTALDYSLRFIRAACAPPDTPKTENHIGYLQASGLAAPFRDRAFDFAIATMSLMDMPRQEEAIAEAWRVLKPGGFFQFSICHPCFQTNKWRWILDKQGNRKELVCGDYFDAEQGQIEHWIFNSAPEEYKRRFPRFQIPRFPRTLSFWINTLLETGFILERIAEPHADPETVRQFPQLADTRIIAYFLILRCRKPANA